MAHAADAFNRSGFSRLVNSRSGRFFRLAAGAAFLVAGYLNRSDAFGIACLVWSVFPLSAGAFDVCYLSAMLGGPLRGPKIRALQGSPAPVRVV